MKDQYKTTEEYLNIVRTLNHFNKNHVALFNKRNRFKLFGGVVCLGLGLLTLPIPLTTPPLLALGFLLLGITKRDIIKKKKDLKWTAVYYIRKDRGLLK